MSFLRSSRASSASQSSTSLPVIKTVLQEPTLVKPPPRPARPTDGDQKDKYEAMLAHFSGPDLLLPEAEGKPPSEPLGRGERMWLAEDCFLRYLRANNWVLQTAITKLTSTLVWRRENGLAGDDGGEGEPGGLNAELIKAENRSGKDYVNGWDEGGRPLHYQVPSRNESKDAALNVKYCVWVMERSIDMMPPGVEKQVLLVSFAGGMSPPPIPVVRGWISMLSHHYPERMGKAIAINVPWILNQFFKLILPLIDPVTRAKLSFNEPAPWIPNDQLETSFGGQYNFEYQQDQYLPSLLELCSRRRAAYRERWVADGSRIGASEWILRGGPPDESDRRPASLPVDAGLEKSMAALQVQNNGQTEPTANTDPDAEADSDTDDDDDLFVDAEEASAQQVASATASQTSLH